MDWDRGTTVSAIGHAGLILWIALGEWLFAPSDAPKVQVAEVSLITAEEFDAMVASAPKADTSKPEPAPEPAPAEPQVTAPEPVQPDLPPPAPEPEPEPAPAPDEALPVSPEPQPVEAPPPIAPTADLEQPIQVPTSDKKPKPRPADKITEVPVIDANDTPEVADVATPEVSDQAEPLDVPVVEPAPAASPEDSAALIAPEAEVTDAPELAPTRSLRPQSRPARPTETPAETPTETAQTETPVTEDTSDAEADAIAAALAEATAEPAAETGGQDLPEGPPMTAGEMEGLRVAINKCWNIGSLSTAATTVKVSLRVEMSEDGSPRIETIRMTGYQGGDEAAAQQAFEAAKRAVIRAVRGCGGAPGYDLDPAKYDQWNVMNLNFDASGMRLR